MKPSYTWLVVSSAFNMVITFALQVSQEAFRLHFHYEERTERCMRYFLKTEAQILLLDLCFFALAEGVNGLLNGMISLAF